MTNSMVEKGSDLTTDEGVRNFVSEYATTTKGERVILKDEVSAVGGIKVGDTVITRMYESFHEGQVLQLGQLKKGKLGISKVLYKGGAMDQTLGMDGYITPQTLLDNMAFALVLRPGVEIVRRKNQSKKVEKLEEDKPLRSKKKNRKTAPKNKSRGKSSKKQPRGRSSNKKQRKKKGKEKRTVQEVVAANLDAKQEKKDNVVHKKKEWHDKYHKQIANNMYEETIGNASTSSPIPIVRRKVRTDPLLGQQLFASPAASGNNAGVGVDGSQQVANSAPGKNSEGRPGQESKLTEVREYLSGKFKKAGTGQNAADVMSHVLYELYPAMAAGVARNSGMAASHTQAEQVALNSGMAAGQAQQVAQNSGPGMAAQAAGTGRLDILPSAAEQARLAGGSVPSAAMLVAAQAAAKAAVAAAQSPGNLRAAYEFEFSDDSSEQGDSDESQQPEEVLASKDNVSIDDSKNMFHFAISDALLTKFAGLVPAERLKISHATAQALRTGDATVCTKPRADHGNLSLDSLGYEYDDNSPRTPRRKRTRQAREKGLNSVSPVTKEAYLRAQRAFALGLSKRALQKPTVVSKLGTVRLEGAKNINLITDIAVSRGDDFTGTPTCKYYTKKHKGLTVVHTKPHSEIVEKLISSSYSRLGQLMRKQAVKVAREAIHRIRSSATIDVTPKKLLSPETIRAIANFVIVVLDDYTTQGSETFELFDVWLALSKTFCCPVEDVGVGHCGNFLSVATGVVLTSLGAVDLIRSSMSLLLHCDRVCSKNGICLGKAPDHVALLPRGLETTLLTVQQFIPIQSALFSEPLRSKYNLSSKLRALIKKRRTAILSRYEEEKKKKVAKRHKKNVKIILQPESLVVSPRIPLRKKKMSISELASMSR